MLRDFAFGIVPIWRQPWGSGSRYLLIRHRQGHWGFPKGHRDGDESDLEAARREFEEETGLRAYDLFGETYFIEQYQFRKKKGALVAKVVKYYPAFVQGESGAWLPSSEQSEQESAPPWSPAPPPPVTIQASEIEDFRWCLVGEAKTLLSFHGSCKVLADCESWLQQVSHTGG